MIASVHGEIAATAADHVVIVVGGVGYKVYVPIATVTASVGETVTLHTSMIVREDLIALYGFSSTQERDLFDRLISVSGVGPRLAMSILGGVSLERIYTAISSGQPEAFGRIPGVGKKTAEKIIFELRDKLKMPAGVLPAGAGSAASIDRDVIEALVNLGYSASESSTAVRAIPSDAPLDFSERLRIALGFLIS
jgi:Holliday junction DNA helicase RuvA